MDDRSNDTTNYQNANSVMLSFRTIEPKLYTKVHIGYNAINLIRQNFYGYEYKTKIKNLPQWAIDGVNAVEIRFTFFDQYGFELEDYLKSLTFDDLLKTSSIEIQDQDDLTDDERKVIQNFTSVRIHFFKK